MIVDSHHETDWARWHATSEGTAATVGIEEEVMLLDPSDWSLIHDGDSLLEKLSPALASRVSIETHSCSLELQTRPHKRVRSAAAELARLRMRLEAELALHGVRAAAAGTHPFAVWSDTEVSIAPRYRLIHDSMRELARREPTFALHVHVSVEDPGDAIELANRMRAHVPLLLALSANSPFWQGRDTGLASIRTPLFGAFPRVGLPRRFADYEDWVETTRLLVASGAIPEPTFLWWDVRLQPRFGTIEVRVMDAQTTVVRTAALTALIQSLARLELSEGFASPTLIDAPELLEENRFLAARDGMDAELIDPDLERRVPARAQLDELARACVPHARALGCSRELRAALELGAETGADRQRAIANGDAAAASASAAAPTAMASVVSSLAERFAAKPAVTATPATGAKRAGRGIRPAARDAAGDGPGQASTPRARAEVSPLRAAP